MGDWVDGRGGDRYAAPVSEESGVPITLVSLELVRPMDEPNGTATASATVPATPAATSPMTPEERASRAFAELVTGKPATQVRADLDRDQAARMSVADQTGKPADTKDGHQTDGPADPNTPTPPASGGKGEKDDGTKPAADEDFLRARAVLRRDNWTDAMMDRMPREEILAHADQRRKVQAAVDRFGAEKAAKDQAPTDNAGEGDSQSLADTNPIVTRVAEYDPELAKEVSAVLASATTSAKQSHDTALRSEFQGVVSRLSSTYPELKTQDSVDRVIARAAKLAETGDYNGLPDAIRTVTEHAILLEFGDRRVQRAQEELLNHSRAARSGQPDLPSDADSTPKAMTRDQRDSYTFALLQQGVDPAEAKRRASKIQVVG